MVNVLIVLLLEEGEDVFVFDGFSVKFLNGSYVLMEKEKFVFEEIVVVLVLKVEIVFFVFSDFYFGECVFVSFLVW